MDRYVRQTMLREIGEVGQRKLLSSSALIVGLGGLGAPVAMYLASSGVGHIGLCDSDTVSLSNLQRQILYTTADLGKKKTVCALERLSQMSPSTQFDVVDGKLTEENAPALVSSYDIVVDCTDNFATRRLIDRECAGAGKPWVHGSIDGFYGCVTVFNHRAGKRYADLYPDDDALADANDRIIGTVGPVPGVIGSLQALEVIKVLTGSDETLDGQLLTINLWDMTFDKIRF